MLRTLTSKAPIVAALGATQIVGYGTIYYAFAILAPSVATEFQVTEPFLFGVLSAGLLLGGFVAPYLGRQLDRIGSARVMTLGSLIMAGLLVLLALSPNLYVFGGLTILIEVLSFTVLYDAAFALLAQMRPLDTRRSITNLTLIAGFASTIFWPFSGWLVVELGWRGTQFLFAALHLVCAALHWWLATLPAEAASAAPGAAAAQGQSERPPLEGRVARSAFLLLGISFGLMAMAISAITVHLVLILRSLGLGETAYIAAMVMGPAQVAVRVLDATLWRDQHPLVIAILSSSAIVAALVILLLPGPALLVAFAFALLLGSGAGLASIVRGAVPVALFGATGLGSRLGSLAAVRSVLAAASPFLFSWAATAYSIPLAVWAALALALVGLGILVRLYRMLRNIEAVPAIRRRRTTT
jgi:MFS family permease